VLRLDALVGEDQIDQVEAALGDVDVVRHVVRAAATAGGLVQISAEAAPDRADVAIDRLAELGIASEDLTLRRVPGTQPGPVAAVPHPARGPCSPTT
jgi:hypothetical protein